jgi:hypothetical protein
MTTLTAIASSRDLIVGIGRRTLYRRHSHRLTLRHRRNQPKDSNVAAHSRGSSKGSELNQRPDSVNQGLTSVSTFSGY